MPPLNATSYIGKVFWSLVVVIACGSQSWPVHGQTVDEVSLGNPHLRKLAVSIVPDKPPKTVQFNERLSLGSPDLPPNDRRIKKQKPGCTYPEQVSLTYWSSDTVLVSWATCDAVVADRVTRPSAVNVVSTVRYGTARDLLDNTATGVPTSYINNYSKNNMPSYASPLLHHVLLKDLTPGQTYFYRVLGTPDTPVEGNDNIHLPMPSQLFNFTMPKTSSFPLKLGVIGDPGQTYNTTKVLQRMMSAKPDLLLLLGDFSYADNWLNATTSLPRDLKGKYTYQPKWDTWARLFQPLLSNVPFMHTDGNHEWEPLPNGEQQKAYNFRYPVPGRRTNRVPRTAAVTASRPFHNLYYAVELPGVYKVIALTSYSPNQTFSHQEEQYRWLKMELEKTDRSKTPWLLVISHAPWYNSYEDHFKEVECFRKSYEPLLVKHQVDVMLRGHVHAYERIKPVVDYKVSDCGPVHLTVGDGGTTGGVTTEFVDEMDPRPPRCVDPQSCKQFPVYQPQCCLSFQDGQYCPDKQPEWSAYREPSFGHGMLELINSTHAKWTWNKSQWASWRVADEVMIIRGGQKDC